MVIYNVIYISNPLKKGSVMAISKKPANKAPQAPVQKKDDKGKSKKK